MPVHSSENKFFFICRVLCNPSLLFPDHLFEPLKLYLERHNVCKLKKKNKKHFLSFISVLNGLNKKHKFI